MNEMAVKGMSSEPRMPPLFLMAVRTSSSVSSLHGQPSRCRAGALAGASGEDALIVGALTDDEMGVDSGSAYIFRRVGGHQSPHHGPD